MTIIDLRRMTPVDAKRLQATVTEAEHCMRFLDVVVPADLADAARRATSQKLAGRVRIKGFRDGKVPTGLVNQRFGTLVLEEAMDKLVRASALAVIKSRGLKPISPVEVDAVECDAEGPVTFKASFEVAPEVEIRRVGGFVVPPPPGMPPLNGEVERHMERLRHEFAPLRRVDSSDEPPRVGDMVSVVVAHAGEEEDGSGEEEDEGGRSYSFILGSDQALPGIQDAIRTLTVGQEGEFDVEFPGEKAGAPGETRRLRIRLIARRVPEVPELNDDFARDMDYETVDELRKAVRKSLEELHQQKLEESRDIQLVRMLVEANDFDVPASLVDRVADAIIDGIVEDSGGKPDDASPEDRARLKEELMEQAEFTAKRDLLLDRLAEDHGLEASEEEVDAKIEAIAERARQSPADIYSALQRAGNLDAIQQQLTARNVRDFLRRQSGLH